MRTMSAKLILFVISFTVFVTGHTTQGSEGTKFTGKVTNETGARKFSLSAPQLSKKARLKINCRMESGSFVWTLRDPNGKSWITAESSKDRFSLDSGDLDVIPGTWTLQLELKNSTLDYEIRWSTR